MRNIIERKINKIKWKKGKFITNINEMRIKWKINKKIKIKDVLKNGRKGEVLSEVFPLQT